MTPSWRPMTPLTSCWSSSSSELEGMTTTTSSRFAKGSTGGASNERQCTTEVSTQAERLALGPQRPHEHDGGYDTVIRRSCSWLRLEPGRGRRCRQDRATYYGTKGTISIAPSGNATSIFLAIGKDIASTFDPAAEPDYVSEGDVFWSHCVRWAAGSTEPIRIEVNIKARRVLQTVAMTQLSLFSPAATLPPESS